MSNGSFNIADLFPHRSKSFIDANPRLFAPVGKHTGVQALESKTPGQGKSDARPVVRIIMHRLRILDKGNAYTATKSIVDCLCEVGLLAGDSEAEIDLQVTQEKVAHRVDQRTVVMIF